jgi:hypothetical protein
MRPIFQFMLLRLVCDTAALPGMGRGDFAQDAFSRVPRSVGSHLSARPHSRAIKHLLMGSIAEVLSE